MTNKQSGEFGDQIGERQSKGTRRVFGLAPPRPPPQATSDGAAPAYERQIVSVYDARPIGAYDGFLNPALSYYDNGGVIEIDERPAATPAGYITVLRKIEYEVTPGLLFLDPFFWRLVIGGITQPNWSWQVGAAQNTLREIDAFVVVPPNTNVILLPSFNQAVLLGLPVLPFINFNIVCNFILDANEPPNEQIGTNPPTVLIGESRESASV